MTLDLLPAVDVADGRAVRLAQGEAGSAVEYGDPLAAAMDWQRQGAEWIHLVDLDAAFGRGTNAELLAEVIGKLDIKVELSGGIQDAASLAVALRSGAARVNLGTRALSDMEWCEQAVAAHGDRIAVSLDVRGRTLAARGGVGEGGDVYEAIRRLDAAGCARYIVTDVARDGMLSGPNIALYRAVCTHTSRPIIASGGVSTLDDVRELARLEPHGLEGVIVGKALYAGAFTVRDALAVLVSPNNPWTPQ